MSRVDRNWGYYTILYESDTVKVKEIVVEPKKSLSMQRHFFRNEHWHVVKGTGILLTKIISESKSDEVFQTHLFENVSVNIPIEQWHKLINSSNEEHLNIIEIQYGSKCIEEDIERE